MINFKKFYQKLFQFYQQSFQPWYHQLTTTIAQKCSPTWKKVNYFIQQHPLLTIWVIWFSCAAIIILASRQVAFLFPFNDETDHLLPGFLMFTQGQKLYQQIITIHQPLPVIIGGLISLLARRANIYVFISDIRFLMSLYWFATSSLLIARFRRRGLIVSLITGLYHFAYLGFYVLAESLVLPALSAILLLTFEKYFDHSKFSRFDCLLFGFCLFYCCFNLLPIIPVIGICALIYLYQCYQQKQPIIQAFLLIAGSFLLSTALLTTKINPLAWWQETIYNLLTIWLPEQGGGGLLSPGHWLAAIEYPAFSALTTFHNFSWLAIWILLLWPGFYYYYHHRQSFWPLVAFYLLIVLLNNRISQPNASIYNGFHLYPYLVGLSIYLIFVWEKFYPTLKSKQQLYFSLLICIWFLGVGSWLWAGTNRQAEYEINYLPQQALVNVINILKQKDDVLLTGEEGWGYLNLLTDLPLADRQNFHLLWSWYDDQLRHDFINLFADHPPTFIYWPNTTGTGFPEMLYHEILPSEYLELRGPEGSPSFLYLHKNVAASISAEVWQAYADTKYLIPDPEHPLASPGAELKSTP
ncbi:hypothetical protein IJJ27_02165 [bacterium]|nr:hypothetical protein [bacterium]